MRNIFKPKTDSISSYVVINKIAVDALNCQAVMPNPFGLKTCWATLWSILQTNMIQRHI